MDLKLRDLWRDFEKIKAIVSILNRIEIIIAGITLTASYFFPVVFALFKLIFYIAIFLLPIILLQLCQMNFKRKKFKFFFKDLAKENIDNFSLFFFGFKIIIFLLYFCIKSFFAKISLDFFQQLYNFEFFIFWTLVLIVFISLVLSTEKINIGIIEQYEIILILILAYDILISTYYQYMFESKSLLFALDLVWRVCLLLSNQLDINRQINKK